jgi:phosphonate transport system substrate-binding protein
MNTRRILLSLAAWAMVGFGGCSKPAPADQPLTFSILSAEDQASFGPLWQPMLDDLSTAIGRKVQPRFSSSYSLLVEAMAANQSQIGWFSAEPALDAIERANAQVFARTVDLEGRDTYASVVIVKKGSGITLNRILACDHTLNFGMGDPKSTSGTLAPMTYLFKPKGIDPNSCFKTVRSAAHAANLFAVANGALDASTNNSVGLDFARVGNPEAKAAYDALQVVWTSPPLPESALVYRKDIDPALQAKITAFFLHYGQGTGPEADRQRAIMTKLHYSAFHAADDSYLEPVRQMEAAAPTTGAKTTTTAPAPTGAKPGA